MAQSKPGSFSAYLEYAQRDSPAAAPARTPGPASILNVLNGFSGGHAPMSEIASLSEMSAPAFREALKKLSDSGFIEISGEPLSEVITLTDKGRDAAKLL